MKFYTAHRFPISSQKFIKLYFDEEYNRYVDKELHIKKREILNRREDEKTIVVEYLVVPERRIPWVLRPLIGEKDISYIEKRVFHKEDYTVSFSITPGFLSGKITCHGRYYIRAAEENCTLREVEVELSVKVPVLGGIAEKFTVKEVKRSFQKSAELVNQYISKMAAQ